jgi:hypothetical protein
MTWTYNAAQLGSSKFMQVRRMIGDVVEKDPQLQDEEINFAMSQHTSIYGAAADCCRWIQGNYSRQADTSQGQLHTTYSVRARNFGALAARFENEAIARSSAAGYAGGISVSDKVNAEQDNDRVPPQFQYGMDDNLVMPEGPVGNEGSSSPALVSET